MTTEQIENQISQATDASADQAAEALAFESSFEGTASPAAEVAAPAAKEETPPAVVETPATEAAPTAPSPKADDFDAKLEMRKLHGRIGALNDQLQQALKTKETEGKPAVLTSRELTRLKSEYPEMAELLEGDIAEVLAGLSQKAPDPKEFEALVARGVQSEMARFREETVSDRHENWKSDLWVGEPGTQRTPEYEAWRKTMTEEQANAIESSDNPHFVIRKLDEFYAWKGKTAKAEADKQDRLKAALTPQGTTRAGPQTMSDEEAERKAFEDTFNQ